MTLANERASGTKGSSSDVRPGDQGQGPSVRATTADVQWESAFRNIALRTLSVLSDCEGERAGPSWDLFDFWSGKSKTD